MKRKIFSCCIAFTLLAGAGITSALAQAKAKNETVTKTGAIEVKKADAAKKEKFDTVLLKVGEITYKLLPGRDNKKAFKTLEKLGGKTVTVSGELLPANPPKYPLAAIKVASFTEAGAAVDAAPAAPPAPAAEKGKK